MKKLLMAMTVLITSCNTAVDMEQQVDELYERMTQEERIAQLRSMYMDDLMDDQGQLDTAKCREIIPYGIGHFSQFCLQKLLLPSMPATMWISPLGPTTNTCRRP